MNLDLLNLIAAIGTGVCLLSGVICYFSQDSTDLKTSKSIKECEDSFNRWRFWMKFSWWSALVLFIAAVALFIVPRLDRFKELF